MAVPLKAEAGAGSWNDTYCPQIASLTGLSLLVDSWKHRWSCLYGAGAYGGELLISHSRQNFDQEIEVYICQGFGFLVTAIQPSGFWAVVCQLNLLAQGIIRLSSRKWTMTLSWTQTTFRIPILWFQSLSVQWGILQVSWFQEAGLKGYVSVVSKSQTCSFMINVADRLTQRLWRQSNLLSKSQGTLRCVTLEREVRILGEGIRLGLKNCCYNHWQKGVKAIVVNGVGSSISYTR